MSREPSFEQELLAKVLARPEGEKVPISRIARELNCSPSVVIAGVAALVMSGAIDEDSLRPVPTACPSIEQAPRRRARPDGDSEGWAVIAEVEPYLAATGLRPSVFTGRALQDPGAWQRWKSNCSVRAKTLARVRAYIGAHPAGALASEPSQVVVGCGVKSAQPSGRELYDEILEFVAGERALTLGEFARLLGRSTAGIANIAKAKQPKPKTVERARAIIAGDRSGFVPLVVKPTMINARSLPDAEARRALSEAAIERRLPGETVASAVAREAEQQGERRRNARESKGVRTLETSRARFARLAGEVEAELASEAAVEREAVHERELDELVSPSSVLRRAQRDWPGQCLAVKAIAAELGVSLGEAWRRVIGAGVDCLQECEG